MTAGFFGVFDMAPERGRVFTAEEDQPGREQVVVLSHRLWRERFASDPAVVGRQITLNERAYDVVGVMPARFDYTADGEELLGANRVHAGAARDARRALPGGLRAPEA